MPRPILLAILGLAACSGPEFAPPTVTEGGVEVVQIAGRVIDSVTRAGVPRITFGIGGNFETTDAEGQFTAWVARGDNAVGVNIAGFEPFARIIQVGPRSEFELPLRRLAPVPVTCELEPQGFRAIVVDLQGRKSLERWSQSTLTLVWSARQTTIGAVNWGYRAIDGLRWEVTIPNVDGSVLRADWQLYDSEGHLYRGSCEPVAAPPPGPG